MLLKKNLCHKFASEITKKHILFLYIVSKVSTMLSKNVHPYVTLVAAWKSHVYASGKNYQGTLREILTDVTTVTSTAGL